MAPDLNTVPPSPYNNRRVARALEPMAPPAVPFSSPAAVLSGQSSRDTSSSAVTGTNLSSGDNTGVGIGPGPLRHPRPLTAADLHMQLEKEQEAVVNRLTRELSLLRQQSASVASNTSSTSTGLADVNDHNSNHLLSGASHPTPSRRHRSSSSLSTRSANTAVSGLTGVSASTIGTTGGIAGSTFSGIAPARDAATLYQSYPRETLSRHDSVASSRRSEASSPSLSSSLQQNDHFSTLLSHRQSISSQHGHSQQAISTVGARSSHLPSTSSTARFEETAHHRSELEMVKRENELLRRRIRELESNLRNQRHPDSNRGRSESASTPAGGHNTSRQVGTAEEDDEVVHVGESAGSVGVGGGL